jgi:LysR family hydrogen peroxide-inducible transcriptional activator
MTLTELRYVVALFDTGHFRKAAQHCNVSQPTLSVAVKKLESELGICLFERSRLGVNITPIGKQFVAQARVVLRESKGLNSIAESGKDPLGSMLSVGAIFTVGPYLFPRLINQLQTTAVGMPLFIEESYTADLRKKLADGTLDAIFIALPFSEPGVVTRPVYEEPFVVVMPKDHPLANQEAIDPAILADHRVLLLGEGHCFRDQVLAACPGLSDAMSGDINKGHDSLRGSSLETIKYMVASGLGITVLPKSAAGRMPSNDHSLIAKPFTKPTPSRTVALAWRVSFTRPQVIDLLTQALER